MTVGPRSTPPWKVPTVADIPTEPLMIKCPVCDLELPEYDFDRQRVHLLANHPSLVQNRVEEARRWDGWEDN
jgi:hypothetical protein